MLYIDYFRGVIAQPVLRTARQVSITIDLIKSIWGPENIVVDIDKTQIKVSLKKEVGLSNSVDIKRIFVPYEVEYYDL